MARPKRPRAHRRVREAPAPRYAAETTEGLSGLLLDSDVIIEILRGRKEIIREARRIEESGVPTYCTAISWAEIHAGIRPGEETLAEAFFRARGEVVLDGIAGRHAGSFLARYAASHGLEIADALIAAAAVTAGLHLWTLNRRHYPMPELELYEPA